jgi:hypothetical protein
MYLLLFPGHRGPAFRAFALHAGHTLLMWFSVPAFRADTIASRSAGKTATHPASPKAASSHATAAASSHSTTAASSHAAPSVHELHLLTEIPPLEPAASAAARHGKSSRIESACKPSPDDLAQFAGDKGNDPDPVCGDHFAQRPGNRTADQSADAQLRKAKSLLDRKIAPKEFLRLGDYFSRLGLNNVNLPRRVKNRRDSIVPGRKCGFCHPVLH